MSLLIAKLNWNLWANHCDLSVIRAANAYNDDGANSKNIIFAVKHTKSYIPVAILTAKDNQKLSTFLSIEFERLV